MIRKDPFEKITTVKKEDGVLEQLSCSTLSILMAMFGKPENELPPLPTLEQIGQGITLYTDGYRSLTSMNKSVRYFCHVKQYKYFKKSDRKNLKDFDFTNKKAIVCVLGHYVYVENNTYYSFFDNDNDKVVAIWYLGD